MQMRFVIQLISDRDDEFIISFKADQNQKSTSHTHFPQRARASAPAAHCREVELRSNFQAPRRSRL